MKEKGKKLMSDQEDSYKEEEEEETQNAINPQAAFGSCLKRKSETSTDYFASTAPKTRKELRGMEGGRGGNRTGPRT